MNLKSLDASNIQEVLRCSPDDVGSLRKALAEAASEEYANMIIGQYALSSVGAAREYRLFLIVKHAYPRSTPSPEAVASLFRMSVAQGRTILRATLRRYRDELKENTRAEIKSMLRNLPVVDNAFRLTTDADYLVEAMNAELRALGNELRRVTMVPGTASLYKVPEETYAALIELS